jgi:hypothetical protein
MFLKYKKNMYVNYIKYVNLKSIMFTDFFSHA